MHIVFFRILKLFFITFYAFLSYPRKYWLITQEAVAPSRYDWKIVDWDVKLQHKQTNKQNFYLRHFSSPYTTDMYMEYVPCIGNSSYSFWWILLKLYRCFKDGLEICILFFQNPEIIFYHFFRIFNLDIFRALILQICIWSIYLV